jgi:hypothetical protein
VLNLLEWTVSREPHQFYGFIFTCSVTILAITGAAAYVVKGKARMTKTIKRAATFHQVLGFAFFFATFYLLSAGISLYSKLYGSEKIKVLVPINLAAMCTIFGVAEIITWIRKNGKDKFVTPKMKEVMTEAEFHE